MPFELTVTSVEATSPNVVVSGKLTSGSFFGPEDAELVLADGKVVRVVMGSTGGTQLTDWPVLPEHNTVLQIELFGCLPELVNTGAVLRGTGFSSTSPTGRRLANEWLESPLFWAVHYYLLLHDEDHDDDELATNLFGIPSEEIDKFYIDRFTSDHQPQPWPYFTVPIDNTRFVEVEYAQGAEPQVRFKLGDNSGPILTGYNSGHFSLPALRWAEVQQLSNACQNARRRCECLLLLIPGIYINSQEARSVTQELESCFAQFQFFKPECRQQLARNIVTNLSDDICEWKFDERLGWLCNGQYAQRNPNSLLSQLREEDYQRIKSFFAK